MKLCVFSESVVKRGRQGFDLALATENYFILGWLYCAVSFLTLPWCHDRERRLAAAKNQPSRTVEHELEGLGIFSRWSVA